jgi:hypothetical protein
MKKGIRLTSLVFVLCLGVFSAPAFADSPCGDKPALTVQGESSFSFEAAQADADQNAFVACKKSCDGMAIPSNVFFCGTTAQTSENDTYQITADYLCSCLF